MCARSVGAGPDPPAPLQFAIVSTLPEWIGLPVRKGTRLKGYDYTLPGAYFLTSCTQHRKPIFAAQRGDHLELSRYGLIALNTWRMLPELYPAVELDCFVVMPEHIHGLLVLKPLTSVKGVGVSEVMRGFKSISAREINLMRNTVGEAVWQRGFNDHVVRAETDEDLRRIREYIINNPRKLILQRGGHL
jgi:putative transposase